MRRRASLLPKSYFPRHTENRMVLEGGLQNARVEFFTRKANNLYCLLKNRYGWMNELIRDLDTVIEIGAGAGFFPAVYRQENYSY